MTEPSPKSPNIEELLENVSKNTYGRSRIASIKGDVCVSCGSPATEFRDNLSRKEFTLSGLCQACQDGVFGK